MRLFGNIYGGEVALGVITALTIVIIPAAFLLLEGLLNFVQALIFSTLMLMYTIIAVEVHEDTRSTRPGASPLHTEPAGRRPTDPGPQPPVNQRMQERREHRPWKSDRSARASRPSASSAPASASGS